MRLAHRLPPSLRAALPVLVAGLAILAAFGGILVGALLGSLLGVAVAALVPGLAAVLLFPAPAARPASRERGDRRP